jgi:leucyl-tRNA synthetase
VIESLSDSTIYMAYYTIAHLLQGPGNVDGSKVGPSGIKAEQLNDAVWDYIFREGDFPADCGIAEVTLQNFRKEFAYWYPLDLRVSGKDLIRNHLTMSLYNHAAIWPGQSETRWPQSFFTNGHVMVDNTKMAKSLGNFITLSNAISSDNCWQALDEEKNPKGPWQAQAWSTDAVRFALADAGDGLEDSNFSSEVSWHIDLFTAHRSSSPRRALFSFAHSFSLRVFAPPCWFINYDDKLLAVSEPG